MDDHPFSFPEGTQGMIGHAAKHAHSIPAGESIDPFLFLAIEVARAAREPKAAEIDSAFRRDEFRISGHGAHNGNSVGHRYRLLANRCGSMASGLRVEREDGSRIRLAHVFSLLF